MPEYLTPGVYIEEIEIGAQPIEGVSTSTAGFLGETERGPTTPQLVTSWLQFQRLYGSYIPGSYLAYAVEGFFTNEGQRCYIGRITAADAKEASSKLTTGPNNAPALTVEALGEGSWGSRVVIKVGKGTLNNTSTNPLFKLSVAYWKDPLPSHLPDPETGNLILDFDTTDTTPTRPGIGAKNTKLKDVSILQTGDVVEFQNLKGEGEAVVITKIDANRDISWDNGLIHDFSAPGSTILALKKGPKPTYSEVWDNLSVNPSSPDYYELKVNGISNLVTISMSSGDSGTMPDGPTEVTPLGGGLDGTTPIGLNDYLRDSPEDDVPGQRKALTAFKEIDEISIVYVPNAIAIPGLVNAIIAHCEDLKSRFAIIDAPKGSIINALLNTRNTLPDTKYAAFYYPWIKIVDSVTQMEKPIPPGGHTAGIYARVDIDRGVYKAPANEVVVEATDLEFQITKGEQAILNPLGINVIRAFPGRGIRIWGARTLSSDTLWKYINVRRLFIYIEKSIERGTQFVVFEPNDEKLWARVIATITEFLTRVWKDGALMGTKPEEAFFVKCDRTTMTQDDLDNGRLICIIGIAPVKPAEFVIFRIAQWSGGSAVTE